MNFSTDILSLFADKWALVTAGVIDDFNTMTISWGGMGTIWNKPVATVYVKPVRYTHDFMEKNEFFTISFFSEEHRDALKLLGTRSGRDCDKVALSGLTAVPCAEDRVTFREAETTLFCRKIYAQDLDIFAVPPDARRTYYSSEAPHTMYIGEIVSVLDGRQTYIVD